MFEPVMCPQVVVGCFSYLLFQEQGKGIGNLMSCGGGRLFGD